MDLQRSPTESELTALEADARALLNLAKACRDGVMKMGGAVTVGDRIMEAVELSHAEVLRSTHLLSTWVALRRSVTRSEHHGF